MTRAASIGWFLKAATVCAMVLAVCWTTPRLIKNIPDFPAMTADEAQFDLAERYFERTGAKVALAGSSLTMRLREEFFQNIPVRNFSLPGGSPLTGAAVIEAANSIRPRFLAIETNLLSRGIDQAMVDQFRMGNERPEPVLKMLRPFRAMAAIYQREQRHLKTFDRDDRTAMSDEARREEAELRLPPATPDNAISVRNILADWNRPNYDGIIVKNASELKRLVDKLEGEGVTIFLYGFPVDPAVEQSRFLVTGRSALADAFGSDNHRWLSLEYPPDQLRWADAIHLDERSAIIVARAIERALSQKMQCDGCSTSTTGQLR